MGNTVDQGQLFGTNVGSRAEGAELHGNVTHFKNQIVSLMQAWDQTELEVGISRAGHDYRDVVQASAPGECQKACLADARCRAFTFVSAGATGSPSHCWLKDAVPDWSSCPDCTSGTVSSREAGGGFEVDVDRFGWDYRSFDDPTPAGGPRACRDACARDERCKAFSYVAAGLQATSARCWLKAGAPAPSALAGVISGCKRGLEVNANRAGAEYRRFTQTADYAEVCQAACAADDACRAWTYIPAGVEAADSLCSLKSGIPAARAMEGYVSGIKGAEF
jgi:hypothetical protein